MDAVRHTGTLLPSRARGHARAVGSGTRGARGAVHGWRGVGSGSGGVRCAVCGVRTGSAGCGPAVLGRRRRSCRAAELRMHMRTVACWAALRVGQGPERGRVGGVYVWYIKCRF